MKGVGIAKFISNEWCKLKHYLAPIPFRIFLFFSAIFLLVFVISHKNPLIVIEAKTRSIQYTVVNSERAAILFSTPVSIKIPRQKNQCFSGLLKPAISSVVKYWIKDNLMLIKITHQNAEDVATWFPLDKNSTPMKIPNGSVLAYGAATKCHNENITAMSLPIWGPTKIGEIPLSANKSNFGDSLQGLLFSGQISLFGREYFGTGIYPAGEFKIPAGVRLTSSGSGTESAWGYALFNPDSADGKLSQYQVSFTTIAKQITVKRSENLQEDTIKVGFLSRLIGDPFYAILGVLLAGFALLGNFILTIVGLSENDSNKK